MIKPSQSKKYSRSLDELEGSPQLDQVIDHDFAAAAPPAQDGISRRRWLQLMGASLAFGSMAGCRYPSEVIAPFAFRPHGRMPGIPDSYATMLEFGGMAKPLLATSYDGRPIKLDGNPDHPDSRGSSDVFTQATILELYDPDRSREPARKTSDRLEAASWDDALAAIKSKIDDGGVAVLAEPSSSPSRRRLQQELQDAKQVQWFEFTSISDDEVAEGSTLAFGEVYRPVYHLDRAKVILSIDCDFMATEPASVRLSGDFAASRDADHLKMSRLYVVESDFSTTGAMADHRLPLRYGMIEPFLTALENALDSGQGSPPITESMSREDRFFAAVVQELMEHGDQAVVMVGRSQPANVHARAFRINAKLLNNTGKSVSLLADTHHHGQPFRSGKAQLKELIDQIGAGRVKTLLILGGNPVFYAPSDLDLTSAIAQVPTSAHLSLYRNETSRVCQWHLNEAHSLECWGDGTSYNGSTLIAQPLIEPMYQGRSALELIALLLGYKDHEAHADQTGSDAGEAAAEPQEPSGESTEPPQMVDNTARDPHSNHDGHLHQLGLAILKDTHKNKLSGDDPEAAWNRAVHDGFLSAEPVESSTPSVRDNPNLRGDDDWKQPWNGNEPEIVFKPSRTIYDGRFANNGWLQELPEFATKLTWDNAALVNPRTADTLNLQHEKIANFKVDERSISLPVFVMPGLPTGTICVWLGYGRQAAGRVAGDAEIQVETIGKDVRPLRTSGNWWWVPGVTTVATSTTYQLATTQDHFRIDPVGANEINRRMGHGSALIREGTFESLKAFLEHSDSHAGADDHSAEEDSGTHDASLASSDHGHGHQWPEGHHLHFENFDLTRASWRDEPVRHRWGMSIDLNRCTGCNACVIACQAENNIPVVGKDQVRRGREMQWMRIDRYYITPEEDEQGDEVQIAHQPVTCQQCEQAPCETVCPVAATTHSDEGLNDMIYNRCIGTRYCGNNCPYKVRRFNYFNYTDAQTFLKIPGADRLKRANLSLQNLMMNPEVTIRSRGVMEKCTFCVQRIQNIKIRAKAEGNRKLRPNEIRTACQDACPTKAIQFGDIQNEQSDVYAAHHNPRSYALLEELNVFPRNRYLARVRNPHPALAADDHEQATH